MTLRKFANWIDVLGTVGIGVMVLFILFLIYASLRTSFIEAQTDDNYEEVKKYVSNFQSWALANDITYSDIKESVCTNLNVQNRLSSDKYVDKETCLNRAKVLLNCNPETKKVSNNKWEMKSCSIEKTKIGDTIVLYKQGNSNIETRKIINIENPIVDHYAWLHYTIKSKIKGDFLIYDILIISSK